MKRLLLSALLLSALLLAAAAHAQPRYVYLTWSADPMTAITVNYHTQRAPQAQAPHGSHVFYDTVDHGADRAAYAFQARAVPTPVPQIAGRTVHRVELTGLQPDRAYWFVAGDPVTGYAAPRAFRTAPAGTEPLRFIAAGDMGVGFKAEHLQEVAAAQEPLFALVGGDLAYANGDWRDWGVWEEWLDNWQRLMVTPDGFTVPLVTVLGNHEVAGGYGGSPEDAGVYLTYLSQAAGDSSYTRRRVGERLVLFLLDSGHLARHGGDQADWLATELERHAHVPVRLATYHVPLFPGFRQPSNRYSRLGRRHWQPLFDRFRLMAAFENHDHVFKRTHPIRGDRIDPAGTLYLGDGSFGRGPRVVDGPRQTHLRRRWYLDRLESEGHVWRVDVGADSVAFAAVGFDGEVFDRVARPVEP